MEKKVRRSREKEGPGEGEEYAQRLTATGEKEKGKQQTGRKGRESRVERGRKKGAEEKFSCGETQMRKTERVNDWAGENKDGRKPVVF